jgi:hypothetical protein
MWTSLYPGCTEDRVPIGHITNGVHPPTWIAPQMRQVYDRHLGSDWTQRAGHAAVWEKVEAIDDGELWETHQALKVQLIDVGARAGAGLSGAAIREFIAQPSLSLGSSIGSRGLRHTAAFCCKTRKRSARS